MDNANGHQLPEGEDGRGESHEAPAASHERPIDGGEAPSEGALAGEDHDSGDPPPTRMDIDEPLGQSTRPPTLDGGAPLTTRILSSGSSSGNSSSNSNENGTPATMEESDPPAGSGADTAPALGNSVPAMPTPAIAPAPTRPVELPSIASIKVGGGGGGGGPGASTGGNVPGHHPHHGPMHAHAHHAVASPPPSQGPSIGGSSGGGKPPAGRPTIIQLPGSMLGSGAGGGSGKGGPGMGTVPGPPPPVGLHAPAPRLVSPAAAAYHGPPSAPHPYFGGGPPPGSGPGATTGPSAGAPATHHKMELHDAFAYLDRVKAEFADQPDVYNRFLQIMREFKANAIDANGVIVRVVQLFKGHKVLIQGFNAFLPRTHHIDPMVAETGMLPPHLMQVAASMGISLNAQGIPISLPSLSTAAGGPGAPPPGHYQWNPSLPSAQAQAGPPSAATHHDAYAAAYGGSAGAGGWRSVAPGAGPVSAGASGPPPLQPSPAPPMHHHGHGHGHVIGAGPAPGSSSANTAAAPISSAAQLPPGSPGKSKSSAQFVRAISYVKKIKHRFATEPDIYKTFLAALHSYHKEQKTIFEVYMEVASLFADHPDLLEEFVLFLPENEAATITSRLAQSGVTAPAALRASSRGGGDALGASPATAVGGGGSEGGRGRGALGATASTMKRPAAPPPPPSKTSKRARQAAAMATRSAEESAFYERVKRYLGDKKAYAEFLKCLNLFCQDIIKMVDLVQLVSRFIGSNEELFGWFKRYIGYKDGTGVATAGGPTVEGGALATGWTAGPATINDELVNEHGELNLAACKKVGSYRIYPKAHALPKSSHRTAIGREVLNDYMVSCPVFNSEDSTFIASKKNMYEEALFKCEDERFELDLLIDHNLATIAVFEPLAKKIETMSVEERNTLTLGPNLGGTSTVIYRKAIRKIYGEKADEVLAGLMKNPAVAVPVVLRRLKQKDEEWRRTQRDWNKIWRDIHLKNYYKALDHQGIEFKANDRKNLTGRNLLQEIESVANERKRAADRGDKLDTFTPHHLEFTFATAGPGSTSRIVDNLTRLLRAYVKGGAVFSKNDQKAVLKFVSSFLPNFLSLPPLKAHERPEKTNLWSKSTAAPEKATTTIGISNAPISVTNDSGSEETSSGTSDDDSLSESEAGVTGPYASKMDRSDDAAAIAPQHSSAPVLLFANSHLYVLVRLLQMALSRLEKLQAASSVANGSPFFTEKKNIVASFLDLQSQNDAGMEIDGTTGKGDFYATLIVMLKQLVSGSLDGSVFEERVRFMFGTAAYPIFTYDKLIQAVVKQVQIILADAGCEQLIRLFDSWNSRRGTMRLSEYSARMAVETTLPSKEPIFRIEYNGKSGKLTIQLLNRLSATEGHSATASAESKWSAYVDNFVKLESNPKYLGPIKIFLARCRRPESGDESSTSLTSGAAAAADPKLSVQYNLECKIAINTYKLFYVENTEDFLYRYKVIHRGRIPKAISARFQKWISTCGDSQ